MSDTTPGGLEKKLPAMSRMKRGEYERYRGQVEAYEVVDRMLCKGAEPSGIDWNKVMKEFLAPAWYELQSRLLELNAKRIEESERAVKRVVGKKKTMTYAEHQAHYIEFK